MSSLQHKTMELESDLGSPENSTQATKLTVVHGDAGVFVGRQDVAAATTAQEASHCVHTLVVTHVAAWEFTLINICVFEKN